MAKRRRLRLHSSYRWSKHLASTINKCKLYTTTNLTSCLKCPIISWCLVLRCSTPWCILASSSIRPLRSSHTPSLLLLWDFLVCLSCCHLRCTTLSLSCQRSLRKLKLTQASMRRQRLKSSPLYFTVNSLLKLSITSTSRFFSHPMLLYPNPTCLLIHSMITTLIQWCFLSNLCSISHSLISKQVDRMLKEA